MQLATMKDAARLSLLKEIGGASVYEQRRQESLKLMVDAGWEPRTSPLNIADCRSHPFLLGLLVSPATILWLFSALNRPAYDFSV